MLAKIEGIAHNLEGKGVLGHSRNDSQVAFRPAGDNDVVVMQACQGAVCVVKFNLGGGKVYPLHALGAAADAGQHLAQRG